MLFYLAKSLDIICQQLNVWNDARSWFSFVCLWALFSWNPHTIPHTHILAKKHQTNINGKLQFHDLPDLLMTFATTQLYLMSWWSITYSKITSKDYLCFIANNKLYHDYSLCLIWSQKWKHITHWNHSINFPHYAIATSSATTEMNKWIAINSHFWRQIPNMMILCNYSIIYNNFTHGYCKLCLVFVYLL